MNQHPYAFKRHHVTRYTFTSVGKKRIKKIVDFTMFGLKDTYNLAFGDLLPDGSIDDKANSNNGDIVKVLSTVVAILKEFTSTRPEANIVFTGSTDLRMKLYTRILRTYSCFMIKSSRSGHL